MNSVEQKVYKITYFFVSYLLLHIETEKLIQPNLP